MNRRMIGKRTGGWEGEGDSCGGRRIGMEVVMDEKI
jgi:hypothetical protein